MTTMSAAELAASAVGATVHGALASALVDLGATTLFGLAGDANLFLLDAYRRLGGRYIPVAHEASAVLAALGAASVSGRPAAATVTHGPGLANTIGALIEGVKAGLPVVLLAGDTPPGDHEHLQNIPQRALVEATGAGLVDVGDTDSAVDGLVEAWARAGAESRPIVLNLPVTIMWSIPRPSIARTPTALPIDPDLDALDRAVGVIARSRRPVVLAGRGAITARDAVLRFARRLGAPVTTTLRARALFHGELDDLGIFGGLAGPLATRTLLDADCVIAFGASLNHWTTADGSLVAGTAMIQIDVDPAALGRFAVPTVGVRSDAGAAADALVALLDEAEIAPTTFAGPDLRDAVRAERTELAARRATRRRREAERETAGTRPPETLDVATALAIVDERMPASRTLVIDGGRFTRPALAELGVVHPSHYVHGVNFGSIGVGMPLAIGAATADATRPVLLVVGDGGFLLGGAVELGTLARLGADVTVLVVDDGAYGAEHVQLRRRGLAPDVSLLDGIDLVRVAEAYGVAAIRVTTLAELERAVADPLPRGPRVLDVRADADELTTAAL